MMGMELMQKTIKRKKKKNIEEEGPEAEGFKEWRKQNSTLKSMGALEVDPNEDDCPPDAVEIGVFRVNAKDGSIKQDELYTQAEAPKFMEEKNE